MHSASANGPDATSISSETDFTDATCEPQTASELCDAVSLSLGLGVTERSAPAPPTRTTPSPGAFREFGHRAEMTGMLPNETTFIENYAGLTFKECHDIDRASCLDMLRSGERHSFIKRTHGPELVRNVCSESCALDVGIDKQEDQLEELPYKPLYYRKTTNSLLSEDACGVRDLSTSAEPAPEGPSGQWYCKYCDYTHGSFLGAWRLCPYTPLSDAEGTEIAEMRGAAGEEYHGRMESYQSGMQHQRSPHVNPAIKTEPDEWTDVTDTNSSADGGFPDVRLFVSHRRVCQVCGDNASGCHYGAVTCGSCKVFFKRAAEGKQNYLCAGRNDCTIDKLRRKNCASCRLRRCYLCGMSLKGRRLKGSGQPSGGAEGGARVGDGPGDRGQRDGETAAGRASLSGPSPRLHSGLSLLSVLQVIEPGMISAGHDPAQPDCPASLLTSLNELGERHLASVVRWAKAIPGFRDLHVEDQLSVIQSSWLSIMVIGLGWRSYTHTHASMLYFAPDLVFNDQRMRVSSMYDQCARLRVLSQRLCALRVTQEEFLCMKALILFSIIPVEGLRSQRCFDELRAGFIKELDHLASRHGDATRRQRLFQLTHLLDFLHPIVRKLHQFTYDLFIQAQTLPTRIVYPDMISEIVSMHVPKILTGVVKPILFHATAL